MSGEAIKDIKSWGYNTFLISEFPNDTGVRDADFFYEANTKDPESALKAAKALSDRGLNFDGVISLCWDCAISVATIAQEFNLESAGMSASLKATEKNLRSQAFEDANVPAPKYRVIKTAKQLQEEARKFTYPLIVKPTDKSSSKGVILVESPDQLIEAYRYARSFTEKNELMINEHIAGSEHSTEGLMIDGVFHPTALSDRIFKYEEFKPYFVEVGDIMPSTLSAKQEADSFLATEKAALAVGIFNGIAKGDIIYHPTRGAFVLEVAARLGGPRFGTEMVPLSNGTSILKAAIQQAVRDPIDLNLLKNKYTNGMVNRSIFPNPGKIVNVSGLEEAKKMPGYYDFKWWPGHPLEAGDVIPPYENTCGNVGYIIATGSSREEAIDNADQIEQKIKITTEPT